MSSAATVPAATFVKEVTTAFTAALEKLLKDAVLENEMQRQREEEEEKEKANRPRAAATTWSEYLRRQRQAYSKLEVKPSLREFMRQCSVEYKTLSDNERKELAARVQEDTRRFEAEMEDYYRT